MPGFAYIILLGLTILSGKEVPGFAYIILLGLIPYCLVKTCLDLRALFCLVVVPYCLVKKCLD
jgi:hypothetical protein